MTIPTARIIKELSRPEAYPHQVDTVKLIQTHISIIFIAGELVYKIKKPVDLGFLDFTTLEKRLHFCKEELRLNRRLSPEIYLDVVSVIDGPEGLSIPGPVVSETAVEYAVVMKKLDETRMLSSLLLEGSVEKAALRSIATRIARFHSEAETSSYINKTGGTEAVIFNTEEDFQQIEPFIGNTLSRKTFEKIVGYTRTFLEVNRNLFLAREADGWIRDGHGDLHTQHICMTNGIQIFDCIEFNDRFRYGDILVDAAFLTMDLERLGFKDLADEFTTFYLKQMKQEEYKGLFNFYTCYRAVVRGKVEGFRSRDPNIKQAEARAARENARNFFHLGEKYSRTLVPPVLITGCGLMGSGKSTLAEALKEYLDITILASDSIRKELAGIDPLSSHHVPFGSDIYSKEFSRRTYSRMHERAMTCLKEGQSVFLDASYMSPDLRAQAMETARKADAGFLLLHLDSTEEELIKRLRKRRKDSGVISDGREEILGEQTKAFSPPVEVTGEQKLILSCLHPLDHRVRETYRRLLATT